MKRTKPFGVGIGPKMSSALAMMVVLGVVTGLTLPATAANIPWPPTVAKEDSNRDKSGTSAVRIEQAPSQAPENKTVMTGDAFQAESIGQYSNLLQEESDLEMTRVECTLRYPLGYPLQGTPAILYPPCQGNMLC